MRTRVKICGIRRPEHARVAVQAGADAIGLVFHESSPRHVDLAQAREIARSVAPFVTVVGLFVDASRDRVQEVLDQVQPGLLQFHGQEAPEYCRQFGRPYIKAVAMKENVDLRAVAHAYQDAAGLLLDAFQPGVPGGTGQTFVWERVPRDLPKPVILAGGLGAGNVAEAISRVRPYAVDVSSGVEREKGVKDPDKIVAFLEAVYERG
jgi:phosphoribosylanthranilate isomerase